MLYILLTVIAVGVLLCSEPGKKILGWGVALLILGGLICLVAGGFEWVKDYFKSLDGKSPPLWVSSIILVVVFTYAYIEDKKNARKRKDKEDINA